MVADTPSPAEVTVPNSHIIDFTSSVNGRALRLTIALPEVPPPSRGYRGPGEHGAARTADAYDADADADRFDDQAFRSVRLPASVRRRKFRDRRRDPPIYSQSSSCDPKRDDALGGETKKPSADPYFPLSPGCEYGLERRAWVGSEVSGHPGRWAHALPRPGLIRNVVLPWRRPSPVMSRSPVATIACVIRASSFFRWRSVRAVRSRASACDPGKNLGVGGAPDSLGRQWSRI